MFKRNIVLVVERGCDAKSESMQLLRAAVKTFRVPLINLCITSNHTHLLAEAPGPMAISGMMQKLQGEFAARVRLTTEEVGAGIWTVQESSLAYAPISGSKIGAKGTY